MMKYELNDNFNYDYKPSGATGQLKLEIFKNYDCEDLRRLLFKYIFFDRMFRASQKIGSPSEKYRSILYKIEVEMVDIMYDLKKMQDRKLVSKTYFTIAGTPDNAKPNEKNIYLVEEGGKAIAWYKGFYNGSTNSFTLYPYELFRPEYGPMKKQVINAGILR